MRKILTLVMISMLLCHFAEAQKKRKPARPGGNSDFLNTQWWLGIRGGINFTNANLITPFSGFYPINYDAESLSKTYTKFEQPGFQIGLALTFYHKGFSLSTTPSFFNHNIQYQSSASWTGDSENERFETDYETAQSITFIDLPIALKYDILSQKIRPFVMAGMFYSFIFDANKSVNVQETDFASGNTIQYDRGTISLNNKDDFNNNWGVLGGIGASFDFWNIRTVVDIQYRHSFNTIVDANERYKDNAFSSFGEVQDDYSLQNYSTSISFVFPLRYIDSQFKAL